ncbi:hypothetical protein FRC11_005553, partial [Ceratobasidium sp. 423]
ARMSVDLRIIYSIDLVADSEGNFDYQAIKIFSISTRARVSYDFWVKVSKCLAKHGLEYQYRCTQRDYVQTTGGRLNVPAAFKHQEYVPARLGSEDSFGNDDYIDSEADMNQLHETVSRERFMPVTKSLYNIILADMEVVLPMALNPDERKIVRHHGTSVVMGRSGTGKTTALIYKMRANAQLATRPGKVQPTRQLFVTRSKVLTQHVARNYQELIDSSDISNKSTHELEEMRQVNQKYQNRELVEYDNSVDFRVDLPHRFSQLKDSHFPLFVSFDKLRELLEGDMPAGTRTLSTISFRFVDEVQDHLMLDVHLIQSLCSNPDGGYWCGDTAQTINAGSSFRMQDLKACIYESMIPKEGSRSKRKTPRPFHLFELTINFRSHDGIVRYAASLVELIYTLFPDSIDIMAPESAKAPGLPPLLFVGPEDEEATFLHYLLDQRPIEQAASFGAHQAIIVRSESTARSLTQRLHKQCTVITLVETKGLEFDDVLLYNFFAESEASTSNWRVILSLATHSENGRVQYEKPEAHITVSPVLCYELKQLYVAITRARHRCWLWDSGTTIDAMKVFWEGLKLITISTSLSSLGKFAASSEDLREWAQRGQEFFSTGLYALAQSCFECAGQDKEATIAGAYNQMTEAKSLQGAAGQGALIRAAKKMEVCAEAEKSSDAASTLWYHAATCWQGAQDMVQASKAYCLGGFYDQAAVIAFETHNMDECLRLLVSYSSRMDPALVQRIEEVTAVHFLREQRYDHLQDLFKGNLGRCIELARSLRLTTQLQELFRRNRSVEDNAAFRIQAAWKRALERQAQRGRLHEFSQEGRLYEEYRPNFPRLDELATERDIWTLRLMRGPCLSIILGLQMLVEKMEDCLQHIDDNLKGENLSPASVAEIQKANKRKRELVK